MQSERPKNIYHRFFSQVYKSDASPDACWEWQATKNAKGYGHFSWNGKQGKAHRAAYELFIGAIPPKLFVCHTCDNPTCVNPAHLWLGDNGANVRDCVKKQRNNPNKGTKNGSSRLSELQVKAIRNDSRTIRVIGRAYKVTHKTISDIKSYRTWVHI